LRQAKDQRILIALNFSSQRQRLALPILGVGAIVISTHLDRAERVNPAELALRPDEGIVVELEPS
jgi:hypothetical protein